MDIRITDIFNINIETKKNNKEYIVLNINYEYIDDYLISINQYNGIYIYKLNKSDKLYYKLKNVGINIDDYIELGNYMIYDSNIIKILLINKNFTKITNKYNLIDTIGNLYIWKPISIYPSYTNIGNIITSNPNELPEDYIGLIPTKHIKIFNDSYSQLFQNDYNLLGCSKDNKKKLLTINILNSNEDNNQIENLNLNEIKFNGDWSVYKSKNIILKENNNPWYNNKKNIPPEYINNSNYFTNINKTKLKELKELKQLKYKINKDKKLDKNKDLDEDLDEDLDFDEDFDEDLDKNTKKKYLNTTIIIMILFSIILLFIFLKRK
jgi:hypothetical protein